MLNFKGILSLFVEDYELYTRPMKGRYRLSIDWMGYYKIAKSSVQLRNAKLYSLDCSIIHDPADPNLQISIQNNIQKENEKEAHIFLKVTLNGPFEMTVVFHGECIQTNDTITDEEFLQFAELQIAPLLLPYARECIASILARMQLPIFHLPTIDVLQTFTENNVSKE